MIWICADCFGIHRIYRRLPIYTIARVRFRAFFVRFGLCGWQCFERIAQQQVVVCYAIRIAENVHLPHRVQCLCSANRVILIHVFFSLFLHGASRHIADGTERTWP